MSIMKKLLLIIVIALFTAPVNAQFTKASLQATGLTCAMCTKAINTALDKISFVESVKADIKSSTFIIRFKENETVIVDQLKDAVEDAGFSIGSLKLTANFQDLKLEKDQHTKIGTENFHFLNASSQVLNGEQTVTVVDKNFLTEKQFKKQSAATKMNCIQTGKAADCCIKEGVGAGERVYHVII
jgi:copper chaperone CopZ